MSSKTKNLYVVKLDERIPKMHKSHTYDPGVARNNTGYICFLFSHAHDVRPPPRGYPFYQVLLHAPPTPLPTYYPPTPSRCIHPVAPRGVFGWPRLRNEHRRSKSRSDAELHALAMPHSVIPACHARSTRPLLGIGGAHFSWPVRGSKSYSVNTYSTY